MIFDGIFKNCFIANTFNEILICMIAKIVIINKLDVFKYSEVNEKSFKEFMQLFFR